jgi:DNA-binding transcriptional ArsR family regulator
VPKKKPAATTSAKATEEEPAAEPTFREVNDPRSLRALAHPVRMALLEAVAIEGPLTATQAGEIIGESATTCSFHFRQLAKYGFVEDAGEPGARERPWRLAADGMTAPTRTGDAEVDVAAAAMIDVFLERCFERVRTWNRRRSLYSAEWDDASGMGEYVAFVTVDELKALRAEIQPILLRYWDRINDPASRPPGAEPVEILMFVHPLRPPKGG